MTQRKYLFAVLAMLLLFAACKGESPTSPSTTPTGTQGGSGTPPTNATVALSVSNASPVVSSTSIVTATVTSGGQPAVNGTAVQFTTNLGTFTDTGASGQTVVKTTTNGVATATLTSTSPGAATVNAIVNNVTQKTTVTFVAATPTPTPPSTAPTITSVSPATAGPEGGTTVTINGTNFRQPLRVIFKCEGSAATTPPDPAGCNGQTQKDAFIVSVTPTQIVALTPQFSVTAGQALSFSVQVITGAGSSSEQTVSQAAGVTLTSPSLTPSITTVTPVSGPLEGGTQVSILGSGFQAPVQVTFGFPSTAGLPLANFIEAQVISVNFNRIVAITPEFRLIDPAVGAAREVAVRVLNINSASASQFASAFRYSPSMQITAIAPVTGLATGGTQVRIDGIGFDDPVQVSLGPGPGVTLTQVIRVSGTQLIVTMPALASPCGSLSGPLIVTNVSTGETATSTEAFTYIPVNPSITGVSSTGTISPGTTISIAVVNPGVGPLGTATPSFVIGGTTVGATPNPITNGSGTTTFAAVVPSNITFPTQACTVGGVAGVQSLPATVTLAFTNATTGCTTTLPGGITVQPTNGACVLPPPPSATLTSPAQTCPATPNLAPNSVVAAGANAQTATITITNAAGTQPLILGAPVVTNANAANPMTVAPTTGSTVAAGASATYTVTTDPAAAGATGGTITFSTNDPTKPTITVTVCGNAT